jgi:hypothetical protein
VAEGRERADQVLARHAAAQHRLRPPRRHHHDALAHRARLSGAQGRGRARPFRGPRMDGLPPPRHPVHRRLRLPRLRAERFSPLARGSRPACPAACRSPRLAAARRPRSGPSDTCRTRSPPCAAASRSASHDACRDARAAQRPCRTRKRTRARDAVRLVQRSVSRTNRTAVTPSKRQVTLPLRAVALCSCCEIERDYVSAARGHPAAG